MLRHLMMRLPLFSERCSGIRLRRYQLTVVTGVLESIMHKKGRSFVVMFPRQSGKNELQAQLEAYLLLALADEGGEMIKVSPTLKPQALNAMRRLERVLEQNRLLGHYGWRKEGGNIYRLGRASITFLSGEPSANIVGATATTLLEVDEAQDVLIAKYDKDIAPMAASANATRIFWGTAWRSDTLLGRELRIACEAQSADGIQRAFRLSAGEVSDEVPEYAAFVAEQVARLGRHHPLVRTQFFSEEVDGESGMFPERRRQLMLCTDLAPGAPQPGMQYALLVDVAGQDEGAMAGSGGLANPTRDATALTVVAVDTSTLADAGLRAPTYRAVWRQVWVGTAHTQVYAALRALAQRWQARQVVVDATGVGAGLAAFLEKALPGRVLPFTFSAASKSKLGWDFLAIIEAGRWREPRFADEEQARLSQLFLRQLTFCRSEVLPGAERRLKWGVPDGSRDPQTGEPLHDDLIISAALCAALESLNWGGSPAGAGLVAARDALADLDRGF